MRLCVYCASSNRINQTFFDATERLAKVFLREHIDVVYGGGANGLMGRLADTIIQGRGRITGVIPGFMNTAGWTHKKITETILTETMHERKARLIEGVDGVVAMAGGSGTLEELFETITLKRLGKFTKPIIIINTGGFFDPLMEMLEKCISEKFMDDKHLHMWNFIAEPEEVMIALKSAVPWNGDAINFAINK